MRSVRFGRRCGLVVSEYALGTGNFGTAWGWGADRATARAIFDGFADAGGTFLDTANSYQYGEAESLLGDFLASTRDTFVLATKYTQADTADSPRAMTGNSRKNLLRSVEASLRRLRTDHVDLLWVHAPDDVTPLEEILRGMDDLVAAGKILYAGLSNFPAWSTARAVTIAELTRTAPVVGIQVEHSLAYRDAEREQLPMADALGLGVTTFSPLGGGLLSGKYRGSREGRLTGWQHTVRTEDSPATTRLIDTLLDVADELGATPAATALAWLREQPALGTARVPVIGPRDVAQLDVYLGALQLGLDDSQLGRLDEASRGSR